MVDTLVAKTRAWEEDRGLTFTYDGVPLLAMLDEYAMLRHEREEEKRRLRVSVYFEIFKQPACISRSFSSPSSRLNRIDLKQSGERVGEISFYSLRDLSIV